MKPFAKDQIRITKPECRMSNKEFRMMKFNKRFAFLRHSTFFILHSAVYPPLAGSLFNFIAACIEITI